MKTTMQQYEEKTTSPRQAMERVKSGDTIVYGMSIAQPPALLAALAERARSGGSGISKSIPSFPVNTQQILSFLRTCATALRTIPGLSGQRIAIL
ncbi:MAG: hypothetical protein Q8S57_07395 [Methanoregula sp.]|nr:hypothetical protein [Methanoregula sp.]